MPGPLDGFVVVEACQMVAGPLAGTLLADLGADVVKIETPKGGDRMRYLGHRKDDLGAMFAGVNRGKRSVVLDLQQPDGHAIFCDLVARSDVFIQNFRPGVVERLGIDEPALRALRPELIYVSVSGFGDTGPYVDQKSYDYVIQALSGMAALQGGEGTPQLVRNIVVDKVTAYTAAQSVMAALVARLRGHGGQHIRLSMIDVALAFLWPDGMMQHAILDTDGLTPGPHMADGYLVRPTLDGHLALMATSDTQFPRLCAALGTGWLDDPRFATLAAREANADTLNDLISVEVARHPATELVARLHAHDVPCAAVNPLERVHLDPQVQHNETLVEHDHPWLGRIREPRPPAHYSVTATALGRHAPRLDEHTDEVLTELGRTSEQIADLRSRRVIGARR